MTEEALEKLNKKQRGYCESLSVLIEKDRKAGKIDTYEKNTGKLRGYLESMEDLGVITNNEMKTLYYWYVTESRKPE